jgi:hypothetical protein
MAEGDLITETFQFEFNGVLLGPDTNYDLVEINGLDMPAIREGDLARPSDHGHFDLAPDKFAARIVEMTLEVISNDFDDIAALQYAFMDREGLYPLVFQLHDGIKKRIYCRVRRRHMTLDTDAARGDYVNEVMFWAPDPRVYENDDNSSSTGPQTTGAGFGFPMDFTISFGASTSGAATCTNSGNIETRPVVTLTGPMSNPSVANLTTGLVWSAEIDLVAGEVLVVDFDDKTVLLNGTTNRYSAFTGQWWTLVPGDNTVQLQVSSGAGSVQIAWRSAWDSAV